MTERVLRWICRWVGHKAYTPTPDWSTDRASSPMDPIAEMLPMALGKTWRRNTECPRCGAGFVEWTTQKGGIRVRGSGERRDVAGSDD